MGVIGSNDHHPALCAADLGVTVDELVGECERIVVLGWG
jgi:hypothetical protein